MFENIIKDFNKKIDNVEKSFDKKELESIKNEFFSKKGIVAGLMSKMREVENKKEYGASVNTLKEKLLISFEEINEKIIKKEINEELLKRKIDFTRPSKNIISAKRNILLKTKKDIEEIFISLGYEVATGPEIETDYYNFEALNLNKDHPARDMQDSMYIDEHTLLRTHTSGIQSRTLEKNKNKELKIICPGKVYRRDDDDATHSHQFMQIEGLVVVNKESTYEASLSELKTTLTIFVNTIFEKDDLEVRFRPSFFPFTEPSVEVDVTCSRCMKRGCSFCKNTGFIEILGSGVVHKNVLKNAGYDTDKFIGFAFGIGVERIALLKYNIEDIRNLYINDLRFINQF